jgi:hypothetical protein
MRTRLLFLAAALLPCAAVMAEPTAEPSPATGAATAAAVAPPSASSSEQPGGGSAPATDSTGSAGTANRAKEFRTLDQDTQALKQQVLDLNRDLFVLQENLLFPANTQVAVFVSMDVGTFFDLDTVKLTLDGDEVGSYLYTPREVHALEQGGVQRMYVGNLKVGQHELVAVFTGKGPHDRDYRRATSLKFDKGLGAKFVELKISDLQRRLEPEFKVKVWE